MAKISHVWNIKLNIIKIFKRIKIIEWHRFSLIQSYKLLNGKEKYFNMIFIL